MPALRLITPWLNAESPLSLSFLKNPKRVVLRLSESWGNFRSPLKLRYEDEVKPKPPIRDGSIGLELIAVWVELQTCQSQLVIANDAIGLESQILLNWYQLTVEYQLTTFSHTGPSQENHLSLPLSHGEKMVQTVAAAWLSPFIHQRISGVVWASDTAIDIRFSMDWQLLDSHQIDTSINCYRFDATVQWFELDYDSLDSDINHEIAIPWGPHKAAWICSTDYRPPQAGLITMRFSGTAVNGMSPITLRFTASDKHCYFDNGGGAIDANPPLPNLDFKIPIEPQIRRSYLMQPQISCIRMIDGLAVVLKSVSISQSRSQWASSGNVTFSSSIDAERAANELLKITINGYDFYLWCEIPSESKAFGMSRYSASGRGRFAEQSAPYVKAINYVNTQARSFMGLMGDIIENTGWTLASEITDFNVPANAFSYAAKTPAEALSMMATAIGGMLDIDNETKTITVIPQWPTVPWGVESAISDVILHDAVILEFTEKHVIRPAANAVFVRGEQQGVAVKVKRTGSAGDNFAADIVDKLITDNQAARMRGTAELANAGNKVQNTIRTKVMPDLPPMRPGMLIGVRNGSEVFKSVCDAFTISANVNDSTGAVTVNQNVTLLRNEVIA